MSGSVVVNFFGGPGYGKSTCAAIAFSELKKRGYSVEIVFEFTKELFYYSGVTPPYNQAFVFGNQLWKIEQCTHKNEIVLVDSPLPLSIVYNNCKYLTESFNKTVFEAFNSFNNLNFLLDHQFAYQRGGRYQNEDESHVIHRRIIEMLAKYNIPYSSISPANYALILDQIVGCIK